SDHAIAWCSNGTRIAARHIILCCGHEFGTLFPERFQHSDIQRVRLQMLRLRPTPGITMPGDILTDLSVRWYECFSQCPSWSEIKSREPNDSFEKQWGIPILFKQEPDGSVILGD
ncbi:MAG: TIGR03364 family FAD-dependent oxidoreductase, partial [Planctomycetota bacterium]